MRNYLKALFPLYLASLQIQGGRNSTYAYLLLLILFDLFEHLEHHLVFHSNLGYRN